MPLERARPLLVQGQIQRRRGERRTARATLQHALAVFQQHGARLWAEKTAAEIARIGVRRSSISSASSASHSARASSKRP
jgi:hypothetical protein